MLPNEQPKTFCEPWEAGAFALAVKLSEAGYFTWPEWTEALAEELKQEPDVDGSRYYEFWLGALEKLVAKKGLSDAGEMERRKEAWADAYRHTPHGMPVELKR